MNKSLLIAGMALLLAACAGPTVTRIQSLDQSADAPYGDILVVSLFQSFDLRRFFEEEIVKQLQDRGVNAVASTSLIPVTTPLSRESILKAVDESNADGILVTQLLSSSTTARFRERRPESTYNLRPTYYFNVWSVEYTEYVEPKGLEAQHDLTMATEVFSASTKEPVWTIETQSRLMRDVNQQFSGTSVADEAKAIANAMSRDGLLDR
jgi:hypothetical protein